MFGVLSGLGAFGGEPILGGIPGLLAGQSPETIGKNMATIGAAGLGGMGLGGGSMNMLPQMGGINPFSASMQGGAMPNPMAPSSPVASPLTSLNTVAPGLSRPESLAMQQPTMPSLGGSPLVAQQMTPEKMAMLGLASGGNQQRQQRPAQAPAGGIRQSQMGQMTPMRGAGFLGRR